MNNYEGVNQPEDLVGKILLLYMYQSSLIGKVEPYQDKPNERLLRYIK